MESILYMASLAIISLLSLVAVLHNSFNDNLVQRIGLTMVCLSTMVTLWQAFNCLDFYASKTLFTYGIAVYAIGTAYKCWYFNKQVRP